MSTIFECYNRILQFETELLILLNKCIEDNILFFGYQLHVTEIKEIQTYMLGFGRLCIHYKYNIYGNNLMMLLTEEQTQFLVSCIDTKDIDKLLKCFNK